MKTSNKLLVGFLSTIFIVIAAILIDIRVFGEHKDDRSAEAIAKNLELGDFKHVHVENLRAVKIAPSASNHIHFVAHNDTATLNITYAIEGDTLKIIGNSSTAGGRSYTLYASSMIESLTAKGSYIRISGLRQDSIRMKIINGEINSFGSAEHDFLHFNKLVLEEVNSRINFHNARIDTLKLEMEKSSAGFNRAIDYVNASIRSHSQLHLKNAQRLELLKDADSRIYMQ